ncbi:MAG: hypothetical protein LBP85_10480 [Prevotellaceae bacterium]|jgi:chromosomal replication initiation ATPase DnaA|nr:hypothetical protein [Prevotellaceae bacterium]
MIDHYKIIDIICLVYDTSYKEIIKPYRNWKYIYPRYACYWFLRKYTSLTTTKIGLLFGKKHSTVINAGKPYDDLLFTDKTVKEKHEEIERRLVRNNIPYSVNGLIEEYDKW